MMYVFHTDGGHGWLAVKRLELRRLGILKDISRCSMEKGETVYLEEDCDMTLFLDAKEAVGERFGVDDWRESYRDRSPVRGYACFQVRRYEQ